MENAARMAILDNSEEILTEDDLNSLLATKKASQIRAYCGYEPSGPIHLGHLVTLMKLKQLHDAGIKVIVLLADYHAWLNRKGEWEAIHEEARRWEESIRKLGLDNAQYILGSTYQRSVEYFDDILILGLQASIKRGIRSMEMVARDYEHARISQIFYPLMQIADIKHLKADIAVGGMEQRKIHALGRETCKSIGLNTFVAIHTPLISSLLGEGKMSSSIPDSNISLNDNADDIRRKVLKAHCPAKEKENNPILQIAKYIVFPSEGSITVTRQEKYGGNIEFSSYDELEKAYTEGLHPLDLKEAVAKSIQKILGERK
jgi:tyrosyl-tRNA synthetase